MHTSAPASHGGPDRWTSLLAVLEADVGLLVEEFLGALHDGPAYYDGAVDMEDLRATAKETFLYLLDRLAGRAPRRDSHNAARRLGRRRAAQRVPVDALAAAVRLDFIVLWHRLRSISTEADQALLLEKTEVLLTTVEAYISEVQREFLLESARLSGDARVATERHLGRLFRDEPVQTADLAAVAAGLRTPVDGTFDVLLLQSLAVQTDPGVVELLTRGSAWGYAKGEHFALFRPGASHSGPRWPELRTYGGLALGRVSGLEGVRRAVLDGHRLLLDAPPLSGRRDPQDIWHHHAAKLVTSSYPRLWEDARAAVHRLTARERAVLLTTVRTYLETGSVKTTATAVSCHRNTVVNRLREFSELTSLDVTVPSDAAQAWLLMTLLEE